MKKVIFIITLLASTLISTSAISSPASAALGSCMVDSLNGKEKKRLAQWIYFAMSLHPEIKIYSNITDNMQDDTNKYIGNLITRLLTEDCEMEAKIVLKKESTAALSRAFELVGKVAMQELMADKNVSSSISAYAKYLDKDKLNALMTQD